jgi:bifunctional enzyme CysN/CysC/sulfate adenylyltransferase subunit 1
MPAAHQELREEFAAFLERDLRKDLLRFTTAGSVDDGKSTLIGRLLHDSKSVYEDQLSAVKKSRINRAAGPIDFSLLTDGLRAEREQGITIDVAYRYFATARRKFIIADTPGHEQYTRNMATGASTADLAIVLIDATKGLLPQTRRHAYIASLIGIPNVLAAVNKMDLMDYREDIFLQLQSDFFALAAQLGIRNVLSVPISALEGDNVVSPGAHTPWYQGPTLLEHLETVPVRPAATVDAVRFPIQCVIRPDSAFRGFAGQVASGVIRPGDPVIALPSGQRTSVYSIVTFDGEIPEASHPMSVTLRLADEIDLSRGDMLVSPHGLPRVSRNFQAMVVWLHPQPLELGKNYFLKHAVRTTRAQAVAIHHRVNVHTFAHEPAHRLEMNDIASVEFESASPLFFDSYERNRATGSFILIDPLSNATVGAAMLGENQTEPPPRSSNNGLESQTPAQIPVTAAERFTRHGHRPAIVLAEGRDVLAGLLERALFQRGYEALLASAAEVSSPEQFLILAKGTQAAGIILIYAAAGIELPGKDALRTLAADGFYDLTAEHLPVDDYAALEIILRGFQALRIRGASGDPDEVN